MKIRFQKINVDIQHYFSSFDLYSLILIKEKIPEAFIGYLVNSFTNNNLIKSKAYYNLGNTSYKINKKEEAIAYYRKALELNPNDKDAKYNYELLKYQPDPPNEENQDQEQQEQEQQEQEQLSEEEKSQDLKQAESILDALKQEEQIMQKKQIARSKSKKLAKDW